MDTETLIKISRDLERNKGIIFAYLYGSAARGEMREDSDVDIAVFIETPEEEPLLEAQLSLELEKIAKRSVDVRIINHLPAIFIHQVLKNGKLLFSKDDKLRVDFEVRKTDEYLDFLPLMREYDKKRLERYGIG